MIILQLDSEQLVNIIKSSVRNVIKEQIAEDSVKSDEFLDVREVSILLKLSIPTVYGLVHRLEIPVNKRGNRLYFSKQEVTEWIKAGKKKTISDYSKDAESYLDSKRKGR